MKTKIIGIGILTFLIASVFFVSMFTYATNYTYIFNDSSTYNANQTLDHIDDKYGNMFATSGCYLQFAMAMVRKAAGATGNLRAEVWNKTSHTMICASDNVSIASISDSVFQWVTYAFHDNQLLNSTGTQDYVMVQRTIVLTSGSVTLCTQTGSYPTRYQADDFDHDNTFTLANNQYCPMVIYVADAPAPTPTPTPTPNPISYSYEITPTPTYNFWDWGTSAILTQNLNYTYTGHVTDNQVPYVTGNYSVYKTALFKGNLDATTIDNAVWALGNNTVTLNSTGTFSYSGLISLYLYPDYWYNSVLTYQGFRINGTSNGGNTFSSDLVLVAQEPELFFSGTLTGGHYGANHVTIAVEPTEVYLQQNSVYTYTGEVWVGNVISGTGNFTTYSTGLGSTNGIFTTGTYTQIATGNVSSGAFTFNLASRQASTDVYEGYRVVVVLDDGKNYTRTYNFRWSVNVWTSTPVPTSLFGGGGLSDTSGLSGSMTTILNFLLLFLLIGAPAFILGVMGGLPGLIIGAVFGLGIGAIAGLIPFWFIFLAGSGTVAALFMWRKNNGQ